VVWFFEGGCTNQLKQENMKKLILVPMLGMMIMAGCNNMEKERQRSQMQLDSASAVTASRDSVINDFIASFNEIEKNLDEVNAKQNKIASNVKNQTELKTNVKDRINADIESINMLMTENRKKIESLSKRLRSSNVKIKKFEETVAMLNEQLGQKEDELADLNSELSKLSTQVAQLQTSVDTLTSQNSMQGQTIEQQTHSLHTAYYVVGYPKDLEKRNILNSKGGVLGLGSVQKMKGDVDNSQFKEIDYTQTLDIPIDNKDVKIVTSHPTDTYTLKKDSKGKVTNINITNPEKFWSISKYLVVVKG